MAETMTKVNKGISLLFALVLAMFMCAPALTAVANADEDYYMTWSQYKEANGTEGITWNIVVDEMDKLLDEAKRIYTPGDEELQEQAAKLVSTGGYYGWYETTGFERTVMGSIGNGRVSKVELAFSSARSAARSGVSNDEFNSLVDELSGLLHEDANILDGTTGGSDTGSVGEGGYGSAIATFIAAFGIIVREGIEAILVIGAIIAYLVKSGNKRSIKQVYIGAILGIVCSFIAAWLLTITLAASQAPQEIIEGCTALFAVVVLFWVSNWMLSKSESKAWSNYIEKNVESSVEKGSVFALAFTAWLAVFREGAEVILFYQPIIQSGEYLGSMWIGFIAGCVVIAIIFILMRFFSVRLPLKPFFLIMSILMFVMCISFLGGGIKELIEGEVLPSTPVPGVPQIEVLGIYPIAQTLIPQLILLIITVITFVVQIRRNRAIAAEKDAVAVAGSAEEIPAAEVAQIAGDVVEEAAEGAAAQDAGEPADK